MELSMGRFVALMSVICVPVVSFPGIAREVLSSLPKEVLHARQALQETTWSPSQLVDVTSSTHQFQAPLPGQA